MLDWPRLDPAESVEPDEGGDGHEDHPQPGGDKHEVECSVRDPEAAVPGECFESFLFELLEHLPASVALQGGHAHEEHHHTERRECKLVECQLLEDDVPGPAWVEPVYELVPLGHHRSHTGGPHHGVPLDTGSVQLGDDRALLTSLESDGLLGDLCQGVETTVQQGVGEGLVVGYQCLDAGKSNLTDESGKLSLPLSQKQTKSKHLSFHCN